MPTSGRDARFLWRMLGLVCAGLASTLVGILTRTPD